MRTRLIAVYDMDRTITVNATLPSFLRFAVQRRAPWRAVFALAVPVLLAGYALRLLDRSRLKTWLQRLFVGRHISPERLAQVAAAFADRTLADNLHRAAAARIAADKASGYDIILCSASFDYYVQPIAERLGIAADNVLATHLVRDARGHYIAQLDGPNCYGPEKLRRLDRWFAERGLDRKACHIRAYSDHESDVPLLGWADEAFATTPTPALKHLATRKGWTILDFS